jgi:hypothetical protein
VHVIGYHAVGTLDQITMYRGNGYTGYIFQHVSNAAFSGTILVDMYYATM